MRVAVTETGRRCGETHYNATVADATVRAIRDLHEIDGLTCREIARRFQMSWSTVRKIAKYERRVSIATAWREVADVEAQ